MAGGGLSASPPSTVYSCISSRTQNSPCPKPPSWGIPPRLSNENHRRLCSSDLQVNPTRFAGMSPNISFRCSSSTRPGGPPGPGESDSRSVLDAFFLGKALAEALNERIESAVGEFLSAIGRLQAEQQKQVQDFQEEVLERAKRAKEKAAREALEAQGLISKSSTEIVPAAVDGDTTTNLPSAADSVSPPNSRPEPSLISSTADADPDPTESEPRVEVPNED